MQCQSAPISPRSGAASESTASEPAWLRLSAEEFFNDVERRAVPVSPSADFDRVFQAGRHNSGRLLALRSVPNQLPWSRFGYALPKRVGGAVVRNRIRRRLRELLRLLPLLEGYDLVISVRPPAATASFEELKTELALLLKRARLLADPARPHEPPSP
jgi:ribonuclease P protein component